MRVYHGKVAAADIERHVSHPNRPAVENATLVLAYSFDTNDATDASGNENHGTLDLAQPTQGRFGHAMKFTGPPRRSGGSFVKHRWAKPVPLFVRAMALAKDALFVAGPPDLVDEEEAFDRQRKGDVGIQAKLADQDAALAGSKGALLWVVSTDDGKRLAEYRLAEIPTWDGMALANRKLYLSTTGGRVLCFAAE